MIAKHVQSLKGRLELHFLPGYAPELTPDEFVWNHLKKEGVAKKPLRKNESLKSRVEQDLKAIGSRPDLVRSLFRAPSEAEEPSRKPGASLSTAEPIKFVSNELRVGASRRALVEPTVTAREDKTQ